MLISVVCVSKDDKNGLLATVRSLCGLSKDIKAEIEVVVVERNECSSLDDLAVMCASCELKFVYVYNQDNSLYDAMNIGIENSTGSLLWFLNGGDVAFIDESDRVRFLEALKKMIAKKEIGVFDVISESGVKGSVVLAKSKIIHQAVIYPRSYHDIIGKYVVWGKFTAADYLFIKKMLNFKSSIVVRYEINIALLQNPGISSNVRHYLCVVIANFFEDDLSFIGLFFRGLYVYVRFYALKIAKMIVPSSAVNRIKSYLYDWRQ